MAKPEVVEGVVKINVPIDYEELQRQIQENEDMAKKLISQKTIDEVERIEYLEQFKPLVELTSEQSQEIFKQPILITYSNKEDIILAKLIRIEEKLDRLLERMSDAETTNSL